MENTYKAIEVIRMTPEQLEAVITKATDRVIEKTNILKKAEDLPTWMTKIQVAKFLQVNVKTIMSLEKKKLLKRYILEGTDSFRYKKEQVITLLK